MTIKPLYIETKIACPFDQLWNHTQEPTLHQQWDLRFSEINYQPKSHPGAPQLFRYDTRIGFGLCISGVGESVATKTKENGEATSVLKFWSDSPLSLIQQGSGYWKYIPTADGIRFLTSYDYKTRWGQTGVLVDKLIFRPLMVWATAWSFDCLRNWLEQDIHPRQAIAAQITVWLAQITLGLIWIYQGLVPKLLYPDTGELTLLQQSGLVTGYEKTIITAVGLGEIGFGLLLLYSHRPRIHYLNIVVLLMLGLGAMVSDPTVFLLPFNPFALNLAMVSLSGAALQQFAFIPRAAKCLTHPHV